MHLPGLDPTELLTAFGYIGLFAIVFAESGLSFGFFLPGDSLLFTAGLFAATGFFNIWALMLLVPLAAITGDSVGYWFGSFVGPRIFTKKDSFLFSTEHVRRAEQFYKDHGPKAIVFARFVPAVRTFTPILAGVASMPYRVFFIYNIVGGILWGAGFPLLGYYLGTRFPAIEQYLSIVLAVIIVLSFLPIVIPVVLEVLREWRKKLQNR